MLRFLSNYLFQNENTEPNEDPTTVTNSSEEHQQGPKGKEGAKNNESSTAEFMDFTDDQEGRDDDDDDDEEDDWVLIGGVKQSSKDLGEQPVALVAPTDDDVEEDDQDGCDEEEDTLPNEEQKGDQGKLMWENKLIEHPSMSVYVDLATSLDTAVTSCVSLSSIASTTSPGESVIVLEEDDEDDDDDEDMDIVDSIEVVEPPAIVILKRKSDTENINMSKQSAQPTLPAVLPSAPVQNGRRKKGHYPCSSSNTSNMPRRHLRNGTSARQTFQMITNSSTWSSSPGSSLPDLNNHDVCASKKKRSNGNAANSGNSNGSNNGGAASACGIAIVGQGPTASLGHHSSNMLNKNLKLLDMFPLAATSARKAPPSKQLSSPKGHFLQESRRRSDLQNYTKHSHVNNDRRSAQQRRIPKSSSNNMGANGGRK